MPKNVVWILFLSFFLTKISLAETTTPDYLWKTDSLKYATGQYDTTTGDTFSLKVFIPGLIQHSNNQKTKARIIIWSECISLASGITTWYLSENEYTKYKNLPNDAAQEDFDYYINKSNLYGTISVISLITSGIIYFYSLNDAVNCLNNKYYKPKGQGFYLIPEKNGLNFCIVVKF